jgi:hypothetical protein
MPMHIESPPLNDEHTDRDVEADLDADRVHWRSGTTRRASGFKSDQFRSDKPSTSRRLTRSLARFVFAVLIGVGGTLAWQHGDEAAEFVRTWVPSLGWLLPVSTTKAPAPAVTSTELQQQLKPMAIDLALVRRSTEQLASNQDQLARKQEQMTQAIATLQAAEQDISQKILAPGPACPEGSPRFSQTAATPSAVNLRVRKLEA